MTAEVKRFIDMSKQEKNLTAEEYFKTSNGNWFDFISQGEYDMLIEMLRAFAHLKCKEYEDNIMKNSHYYWYAEFFKNYPDTYVFNALQFEKMIKETKPEI
jgi:hypothetical protein